MEATSHGELGLSGNESYGNQLLEREKVRSCRLSPLMQLMPATAKAMGVKDRRDPEQSIMGGARFLRVLANRFKGDLVKVLSAYHAGSTRVRKRAGPPYAATDSYVRKVLGIYYALRDR